MKSWHVDILKDLFEHETNALITCRDHSGKHMAMQVSFIEIKTGQRTEPSLAESHEDFIDFLQALVDAAWDFGVRPKNAQDTGNELKATKYHLEDMRSLVFKEK